MKTSNASESSVSIYQSTSRIVPERLVSSAIRWIGFVFLWYVTTFNSNFCWWKRLDLSSIGRRIDFHSCCQTPKTFSFGIRRASEIYHPQNGKNGTTIHIFCAWEQCSYFERKRSWMNLTVTASLQSFTRTAQIGIRWAACKVISGFHRALLQSLLLAD